MDQLDSRGNTELNTLLGAQKSNSTISSSGLHSLAVRRPNTQHSTPLQLIDQRRHTVDFSAWSSPGKTFDQILGGPLNNSSFVNGPSWNDNQASQEALACNMTSNTDPSCKSFPPSFQYSQEIQGTDDENERSMAQLLPNNGVASKHNTNGYAISAGDMFGRRASLSQLSAWHQPELSSFHKHSASLEMSQLDPANAPNVTSSLCSYSSSQIGLTPDVENGQKSQITSTLSLVETQDNSRCLTSEDELHHNSSIGLPMHLSNSQQNSHHPPQYISSRRNSRLLPNPIQPPTTSHSKKPSFDEQILKQHEQGSIRHGGFVPGFDIWSNRGERQSLEVNSSARLDIQSQRRKSESVLHDLSGFSFTNFSSNYSNPPLSVVSTSSTRSASPMDNSGAYQQSIPNFFGEGRSGFLDQLHPLSTIEPELDSIQQLGSSQTGLHPHFPNTSNPAVSYRPGSNNSLHDLCGLCSVQRATISMGNCGHRICNSCYQHEKHRSVRLFQNETPPCPFCTHGVKSTDVFPPGHHGANTLRYQNQYPVQQLSHSHYTGQSHQQRQSAQKQSPQNGNYNNGPEETNDGYPQNRQYQYTFPSYNATPSAMRLRSSSTQFETPTNTNLGGSIAGVANSNTGTGGGQFSQVSQPSYHRSNIQSVATGSSNQRHMFHLLQSSGFGRHTPSFQPVSTALLSNTSQDHSNYPSIGRPGMVGPPTSAWRENGPGSVGAEYGPHDLQYAHQNYPPPISQLQQRRGSQHQIFQPAVNGNMEVYQGIPSYGNSGNSTSNITSLSFPILPNLPAAVPPKIPRTEAIQWSVIRVTNIPWDLSLQDMHSFFSGFPYPPEHLLSQNVHILMDRATGKTFNSAFIELAITPQQGGMVASSRNLKVLKGRLVTVELSSQDELLRAVFPKWAGQFLHGEPIIPGELTTPGPMLPEEGRIDTTEDNTTNLKQHEPYSGLSSSNNIAAVNNSLGEGNSGTVVNSSTPPFVTREEINALLAVCRNYKLHFSRKCAERPFENILSILAKYPWHQAHRVLPLHRDHIFELLKLSIESLRTHLSKGHSTIHRTLLTRMVRTAILTPAFTGRQKAMVLHVSGCTCPDDIIGWMSPPVPTETEIDVENQASVEPHNKTTDEEELSGISLKRDTEVMPSIESQIESLAISCEPSVQNLVPVSEFGDGASDVQSIPLMPSYADAVTKRVANPSNDAQTSNTSDSQAVMDTLSMSERSLETTTYQNLQSIASPNSPSEKGLDKSSAVSETIVYSVLPQFESPKNHLESMAASSTILLQTTSMEVVHTEASPLNPSSPTDTEFPDPELTITTSERSKSENILDAIKIITQSTPRLSKPGTLNQLNNIASGTSLSSAAAVAVTSQATRQQRCEGGETL